MEKQINQTARVTPSQNLESSRGQIMTQNDTLIKSGWIKRSTHDNTRLSEVVEMYESLGFEVMTAPFDPAAEPGCTQCMKATPDRYKTIYTRRRSI